MKYRLFAFTPSGEASAITVDAFDSLAISLAKTRAKEFLEETKAASVRHFVSNVAKQEIIFEETLYRDPEKRFLAPMGTVFFWRDSGIGIMNDSREVMVDVGDLLAFAEHLGKEKSK